MALVNILGRLPGALTFLKQPSNPGYLCFTGLILSDTRIQILQLLVLLFAIGGFVSKTQSANNCIISNSNGCSHYRNDSYHSTQQEAMDACMAFATSHGYDGESVCTTAFYEPTVIAGWLYNQFPDIVTPFSLGVFHYEEIPTINNGNSCNNSPNPINISTGNKFYQEIDYEDQYFRVSRSYNSHSKKWTFNYQQKLLESHLPSQIAVTRPDGTSYLPHMVMAFRPDNKIIRFIYDGDSYINPSHIREQLELVNNQYNSMLAENRNLYLHDASGNLVVENGQLINPDIGETHRLVIGSTSESYDIQGRLIAIYTPESETTYLSYLNNTVTVTKGSNNFEMTSDTDGNVTEITLPDNSRINYVYGEVIENGISSNRLETVTLISPLNNETVIRRYFYENSFQQILITGIEDESSQRISSVQYDGQARAISSEKGPLGSGIERTQITYHTDGRRTLTNALGKQSTYHFTQFNGEYKITQVEGHASANCAAANQAYTYDANGFMASRTDWQGNITTYVHNDRGQELSRTEASGTPQARTITTEWHPDFINLPTRIVEPERETLMTYDPNGRLLSRQVLPVTP